MIRDRLKGLARRALGKSNEGAAVGTGFDHTQDRAFARLDESAEGSFAVMNASVVSSWEVLITDVSKVLGPTLTREESAETVERISDSLVPTLTPIQAIGRKFQGNLKQGVKRALASGQLDDATAPLGQVVTGVGALVLEGWGKTCTYLDPLFELFGDDAAQVKADFLAGGPVLAGVFDTQAQAYLAALAELPQQTELERPLVAAVDAYAEGVTRGLEIALYDCRGVLVAAAKVRAAKQG